MDNHPDHRPVAALYVDPRGCYADLPGVDVWGIDRDARRYEGPYPVVAHPPCARWCKLAGLVESRGGPKRREDDGCFASALAAVRHWGGVLEHPAYSTAWRAHGLIEPPSDGGWVFADDDNGVTCHVWQARYGHEARKPTWLYANGVIVPRLLWGLIEGDYAVISMCGYRSGEGPKRISGRKAEATPVAFRDVLLGMARSSYHVRVRSLRKFLGNHRTSIWWETPLRVGRNGGKWA